MSNNLFSQDTIHLDNRSTLYSMIKHYFDVENENLNSSLERKISRKVNRFNFDNSSSKDFYIFNFYILLDEKGKVKDCLIDTEFNIEDDGIEKVQKYICKLIANSNYKTKNFVYLVDTSYYLLSFPYSVNFKPKLKKVTFNEKDLTLKKKIPVVFYVENIDKYFYFSGLKKRK